MHHYGNCNGTVILILILIGFIYFGISQGIQSKERYHEREKECSTHVGIITDKIMSEDQNSYYVLFNLEHKIPCRGVVPSSVKLKVNQKFLCKSEFCQVDLP